MKPAAMLCLTAMAALSPCAAWPADANVYPNYAERTELAQRRFGDVRFVMGAGRAMNWLEMYSGENLLAAIRDFAVDQVVMSPDGKYFLALSNSSSPSSSTSSMSALAFAVLDRKGHVIASSPHGGDLHYCRRTNWGIGEWVNAREPQATFSMQKNQMTSPVAEFLTISVRGCDGSTVLLGRAPPPEKKAAGSKGSDRGSSFIGDTIANLRGMDPTFGDRTLTLIDGRRVVPSAAEPAPAQESTAGAKPASDSATR